MDLHRGLDWACGLHGKHRNFQARTPSPSAPNRSPKTMNQNKTESKATHAEQESGKGLDETPCSRLVLQRRYRPSYGIPKPWTVWHDHPDPHQIAWGPGQYATLEENMKAACEGYYALGRGCEFRMVRRTDETLWEYSANAENQATASAGHRQHDR